ncbi:hypothetical protein K1Y72_26690 [Actinomadura sp. PM05-2]|uniref:Uncharacterized protein n=1 Tax=Actinomadura parmotrematis TaxID=2864039 RepID=A0ABS7FZW5_9ACTN|nr:hypothetical protein [Actinomadura parmotrematis]
MHDEKERISATLLDLESHPGHRLLAGAEITGATARLRDRVRSRTAELWDLFDRYGRTLDAAAALRARHGRPDRSGLAELTRLLAGPSVELAAPQVPLEQRSLTAAPAAERLTLKAAVERMTGLFEDAARMVADVDAAWTVLLRHLERAEEERRAVTALAASLGGPPAPALARAAAELDEVAALVRTDPLALDRGGSPDPARLDAARAALAALRPELAEAVRLRDGLAARLGEAGDLLGRVRDAERRASWARDEALAKIAAPAPPDVPARCGPLDARLGAVRARAGTAPWPELAAEVAALEADARDALGAAEEAGALITGLLDRREELRGRLDAYRAKAARLGLAEDAGLAEMHARARDLLWTSPCDLRRATMALSGYQQAISSRSKGSKR